MSELFIAGSNVRLTRLTKILFLEFSGVVVDLLYGPRLSQDRMDPLTQFPSPFLTEGGNCLYWGKADCEDFYFHTVPVSPKVAFPLVEPEGFIRMPCSWTLSGVIDWGNGWNYDC